MLKFAFAAQVSHCNIANEIDTLKIEIKINIEALRR
jgi:hypothetical protein